MIRRETRCRARALQMLYAWELQGASPMHDVATGIARITGPEPSVFDGAELLAMAVIEDAEVLDREAEDATDNWRLERIAVVERIILRHGHSRAADRRRPAQGGHRRGGAAGALVRRRARARVRERRARSRRPYARASVNILLVNWQDVRNPQAGGAEIHLFEIFTRLVQRGHRVRLVCSNWTGGEAQDVVRGIEVHRSGDGIRSR